MNHLAPRVTRWALTIGLLLAAGIAAAAAPQAKGQAPGWYRMMVGDIEVTALSDGTVALPVDKLLTNTSPAKVQAALSRAYLKAPVETSVNGYLVNTGSKLVLIDAGAAGLFGPTLGNLVSQPQGLGLPAGAGRRDLHHPPAPRSRGRHHGDGKAVFPNAVVRVDKRDADFWLSKDNLDKAPDANKGFFQGAQGAVKPYADAGKLKTFDGAGELVPGIKAVSTYGHTPGHTVYAIESKGQKMMVWGDLMHVAAVQFPEPAVTIQFDADSKKAAPQRQKAYADAAKNGHYVAVAHVAFPGIGQVRADGKGYRWVPVNYSSNK